MEPSSSSSSLPPQPLMQTFSIDSSDVKGKKNISEADVITIPLDAKGDREKLVEEESEEPNSMYENLKTTKGIHPYKALVL